MYQDGWRCLQQYGLDNFCTIDEAVAVVQLEAVSDGCCAFETAAHVKALEKGRADLKWVMADNEVSDEIQAAICERGF
eukprot:8176599-Karenia_brevis.AAC.1